MKDIKYYFLLLTFFLPFYIVGQKDFTNQYAYRADSVIYTFLEHDSTDRTKHCKSILVNQKKEELEGEDWEKDWTIEKTELLNSEKLLIIENQWISTSIIKDEIGAFVLGTKKGMWLGPYKSDYGQFRFIEITFNSAALSNQYGGTSKSYNWRVFSKKKGNTKCLNKLVQNLLIYYKTGIGKTAVLERKLLKYKADRIEPDNFLDAQNTRQKINLAPFGQNYFILDMEENIVLLRMLKKNKKETYVSYTEYIFK